MFTKRNAHAAFLHGHVAADGCQLLVLEVLLHDDARDHVQLHHSGAGARGADAGGREGLVVGREDGEGAGTVKLRGGPPGSSSHRRRHWPSPTR